MKKIILSLVVLMLGMTITAQNVAVSTNTPDWWVQLGQNATNLTTPTDGWYYRTNLASERLAFDGTVVPGTSCATTFGSIGAPYTSLNLKFDATLPTNGTNTMIILGSNALWGGLGININISIYGVQALKNFDYGNASWLMNAVDYQAVNLAGGLKSCEINVNATGLITVSVGGYVCPTAYQADVSVLGNPFVMVCPGATAFKFKNVIAKKGAVAKSYFPNYSYAIAATSNDEAKGGVTGTGTFDKSSDVTLVATPTSGNKFVNWTENSVEVSTSASYTISSLAAAHTLVANFAVDLGTGMEQNTESKFNVYSAGNGLFTIASSSVGMSFTVVNSIGQQINKGVIKSAQQQLDLTGQAKGTYMVIVNSNLGKLVKKIVRN